MKTRVDVKCDRCGEMYDAKPRKTFGNRRPAFYAKVVIKTRPRTNHEMKSKHHLCEDCLASLTDWLLAGRPR